MAAAPNCDALKEDREPAKLPIGVRLAATMYIGFIKNV
jgi:hypothetical protein